MATRTDFVTVPAILPLAVSHCIICVSRWSCRSSGFDELGWYFINALTLSVFKLFHYLFYFFPQYHAVTFIIFSVMSCSETAYHFQVKQWRRQLVGTRARAPLAFERIFSLGSTLKQVVWFLGSVLGPRMFIMYMADLAELADEQRVNLDSYADDSQIYMHCSPSGVVSVVQQLEGCILEVCHWMSANRLKLNTDKTELV